MYQADGATGDFVITGFEKGIGDSPYSGITDMRSVNPISVPGEASVAFGTKSVIKTPNLINQTSTVTTGSNLFNIPQNLAVESYQWVTFSAVGTSGLSLNTPYFLFYFGSSGGNYQYQLYLLSDNVFPADGTAVVISANSSVTWSTINPGMPKYFTKSKANNFMLDANGRVWSDVFTTGIGGGPSTTSWVYIGNNTDSTSNGNGITVYQTVHNGTGGLANPATGDEWLFVWRNGQIDYTLLTSNNALATITWVYGWKPSAGTSGNSGYLQTNANVNNPHMAIVSPDSRVDYCDANFIGVFYQNIPSPGSNYVGFNPLSAATYKFSTYTILPFNDTAQCLTFLNQYLLIGASSNIIYPWNFTASTYSTPLILLPESNTVNLVTVGNNAYIFTGNRGIIYITNGSQASFFKKIPDHLSGTVEPLFSWGGATYNKNRLYFGFQTTSQEGGTMPLYGGVWAIDIATGALWNCNQLSYGTYLGYTSAIGVVRQSGVDGASPSIGYGLIMGWSDGNGPSYGVDISTAVPYQSGQSYVVSDMIPVGTALRNQTASQLEYKLSTPLLSGESVQLLMSSNLNDTFTSVGTTNGTGVELSGNFPITVQEQQWLLVKAILNSKTSSPSLNRLTQLRVIGASAQQTGYYSTQ